MSSAHNKMIDRIWATKRKRKRLSTGDPCNRKESISAPLESPRNNPLAKHKAKSNSSPAQSSQKKKGNDGYYYECVVCDLGGNLLCCDSCPRVYHLQCLNPPLKRTPPGKWQCPTCCEQNGCLRSIRNSGSTSKRTRSKISLRKDKSEIASPGSNKPSLIVPSSIPGKSRSSCRDKPTSSPKVPVIEKKLDSSQTDVSCGIKPSHSSHVESIEGIPFFRRTLGIESNGEPPEKKPDISCNMDNQEEKFNLPLVCAIEKPKKRKRKKEKKGNKKKQKVEKGKSSPETAQKGKSSPETVQKGKSSPETAQKGGKLDSSPPVTRLKIKFTTHQASISPTEEDSGQKPSGIQQKDVKSLEEMPHSANELGVVVALETTRTCEENALVQQVDRILGCRVRSSGTSSTPDPIVHSASLTDTASDKASEASTDMASLLIPESQNKVLDGNHAVEDVEDVDKHTAGEAILGKDPTAAIETQDDSVKKGDDLEELIEKLVPEGNTDGEQTSLVHGDCTVIGTSETSVPCEKHKINMETDRRLNNNAETKRELISKDLMPFDRDTSQYEFLVKWVGKSHIHNRWVPEPQLKVLAKRKLENYKGKYGTAVLNICREEWSHPQKVIALRSSKNGAAEAFTKWSGLPYDECTWERLVEPAIQKHPHLITEFKQYEQQTLDKDAAKADLKNSKSEYHRSEILPLTQQPKELKGGLLFEHQLEALNWLLKCWHKSKNVILADEMGLGKTVSACAFISSLNVEFKARMPCLVLVPLSTMPNWLSEFALWAPNLNVVEYHGCAKARSIIRMYEWHANYPDCLKKRTGSYKFNVLLTTYEMVLADSSHLRGVPWEVLVVDEGHRLKNSGSKLFSLLNSFSFQHRVLLTGTPLQNNIGEMYNLLNFLQPASFPSLSSFEEKFNDLTTAEKVEELKKLVAPHMLRRLKKDVMKNIPPKTERMVPVELSSIQAEYYRAMLTKNYQVLRNIGKGVAQKSMLNIVMQLRKVCNHPYLITGTEPDSGSLEFLHEMRIKASAKLTLLHSMLKMLHKEGHRVLIFSQMTKLLDILEDYLNIEYGPKTFERVDGSVSVGERQAAIARFNQDRSRFVFLLSTRSCGLGINLATADTVIIYDSDFNPHADIQAMNRAHRIGQSNRLLVYRLVVRASVEERILQLAKKKLMLDQLFVNKSESQKEVEDILRWGTEELFSDPARDVYQDKCTDGNAKILWDENAVIKLLDRSILQSGPSEGADGELENDMLGSVKSLEWNDEIVEEPVVNELSPPGAEDVNAPNSEKEDLVSGGTEENEWDRLLRMRWEKYQSEEEAALGRGKRLRKAVSYSEAFAPHPTETLDESVNEEEGPEREYTPAGRALKVKLQKERLAQRNMVRGAEPIEEQLGPEPQSHDCTTKAVEGEHLTQPVNASGEQVSEVGEVMSNHVLDTPKCESELLLASVMGLNQNRKRNRSSLLDLTVTPPGPSSILDNSLLPVLGLCAPNAKQLESVNKKKQELCNTTGPNCSLSKKGKKLLDFPFRLAPGAGTSTNTDIKVHETGGDTQNVMDTPPEFPSNRFKSSILDSVFSYSSFPPMNTQGRGSDLFDSSGSAFPTFQDKMALPNLTLEDNRRSKFFLPANSVSKSYPDLFPSLSLGTKVDSTTHDLPTSSMLQDFRLWPQDMSKLDRLVQEVPPTLGLGLMHGTNSSLPENHQKVLDNIMMRTGPGMHNSFKKRPKVNAWSEDELDALWVGVRRYGRGNWDYMLRDPKLKFSKHRTSEELSVRWEEELVRIFDEAAQPAPKPANLQSFSGISDAMMTRALHGGRLSGIGADFYAPLKSQSHLTDMRLGYGHPTSGLLPVDPSDKFNSGNERYVPPPSWRSDQFHSHFRGDFCAGPSNRPVTSSNSHLEQPFLPNTFASLGTMGMHQSNSHDLQQKELVREANKYVKLPFHFDKSPNYVHNLHTSDSMSTRSLLDQNKQLYFGHPSVANDATGSESSKKKLPRWLQEAVSGPAGPPVPELPPTVSAIAQSVRLLYGEDKPSIPPFRVPGPPPPQPKDPRRKLKKKGKLLKLRRGSADIATTSKNFEKSLLGDSLASGSTLLAPSLPSSMARPSGFPWIEAPKNLPSLNLNMITSQSSSSFVNHRKKPGIQMSPSPEVLQLVASFAGPGPHALLIPGMLSSSSLGNELHLPKPFGNGDERESRETKNVCKKDEVGQSSEVGGSDQLPVERFGKTESGDSSKTHSDPRQNDKADVEEISSEETLSDHRRSEQKETVTDDHRSEQKETLSDDHRSEQKEIVSDDHKSEQKETVSDDLRNEQKETLSDNHRNEHKETVSGGHRSEQKETVSDDHGSEKETVSDDHRSEQKEILSDGHRSEQKETLSDGHRSEQKETLSASDRNEQKETPSAGYGSERKETSSDDHRSEQKETLPDDHRRSEQKETLSDDHRTEQKPILFFQTDPALEALPNKQFL
ncbi:hypothetical protein IFM89_004463 [Coptis chinensis]|uniref:Protein CHROMATIN REMODELING 4 n=1 Tax=Coptis chinensis TaxID=261450 RepID=A0A835GVM0_9MAGN|nr:hypothetical protein IFM89_004463 [Coptis chinensis]